VVEMESLIFSIIVGLITIASAFAVVRYQGNSNTKKLEDLSATINNIYVKLDKHGEDIRGLQTEKAQYLTSKDADDIYLRIKEFDRFEKHIDKRFDSIEKGQEKILSHLESIGAKQ
jgi:hypothetical protein